MTSKTANANTKNTARIKRSCHLLFLSICSCLQFNFCSVMSEALVVEVNKAEEDFFVVDFMFQGVPTNSTYEVLHLNFVQQSPNLEYLCAFGRSQASLMHAFGGSIFTVFITEDIQGNICLTLTAPRSRSTGMMHSNCMEAGTG